MSLAQKLDAIREATGRRIPAETRAEMGRATRELRESGIMDRVIKAGARLPEFSLKNQDGALIESRDLLSKGTVVLTAFRGSW